MARKRCRKSTKAEGYVFHCMCCDTVWIGKVPTGRHPGHMTCKHCDPYGLTCQAVFVEAALSKNDFEMMVKIDMDFNKVILF